MLTKADDYPVHQTPEPIAYSGTDRNFYDRYFFNGYTWDGSSFFAVALGVYPHLNVMDAAFCVVDDGVQHNLRGSRLLGMERLDTNVGPIAVDVVEPLRVLRVRVSPNEHGITADLTFTARAAAIEEPRFVRRSGPRTLMDYTRLTQNGTWEGWIEVRGKRIDVLAARYVGTRDRSWGIRSVGAADPAPVVPAPPRQFYWLWAPLNFPDTITLYHLNADEEGEAWNTHGVICGLEGEPESMHEVDSSVSWKRGTRHAAAATIRFRQKGAGETTIELEPQWQFYMSGLGYMHPQWGHGHYRGELEVGYDTIDLSTTDETDIQRLHVQAFVKARMSGPLGAREGCGILEQLVLGPFAPAGFRDLLDPAP